MGVVDFGMLHTVLHCLAQQMRVLGKNVELRGSVAGLPYGRENVRTITVSEYIVDTNETASRLKSILFYAHEVLLRIILIRTIVIYLIFIIYLYSYSSHIYIC